MKKQPKEPGRLLNLPSTSGLVFCLTLFCILLMVRTTGQPHIKFTHLTNLDGLSQSTVQAILKDKYGFMWFGTQDGLNRYDGYNFKVYRHRPGDPATLRKSHITSLYEDRQGRLWVGTNNGALSLYDRNKDAFIHYRESKGDYVGLSQMTVTALFEDSENNFWVGTYWKLNLLDRTTGKFTHFGHDPADSTSISNDGITCIFEDSRKNLWVGTNNGLNLMDRKTKKFKRILQTGKPGSISDNFISFIYEDALGRLWIGTSFGLNLYHHETNTFTSYQHDPANPNSLANNQITAIQDAGQGKLWVGTKVFLELFDPPSNHFTHFGSDPNIPTTLSKNGNIMSMLKDKQGTLWVGTYQGGINKYDEYLTYFEIYRNNPQDWESLSFNVVTGFAETKEGNVWVSTGGGALNLWNRATNKFTRFNPDPVNKNSLSTWGVLSIYQGRRYLWIGTYGSGVDRYDAETNTFTHYTKGEAPHQLNNDAVYAIFEDSRGQVWMGTNGGGVNVLDQATGVITKYTTDPDDPQSLAGNFIRCFVEDKKGRVWIGSTGGLSMFDPVTKKFTNYNNANTDLESEVIFSLYIDRWENVWIGTLGGGLNKLDLKTKRTTAYTTADGLPDNTINSIIEDNYGYLWISTNNGLSWFNPNKGTFSNSGLDNGIQSFEFSQGAGLKTKKGEILFGGINGFNVVNPDNLIRNNHIPPVVITGFKLFNKNVQAGTEDSPLQQDILETREITLNHKQSIITFEFAALNFTATEKNQYAYMLEGFDKDWILAGTNRSATYTNLNPGVYVFRVKASNNDGLWNEEGRSIRIIITPPFWQTWWFRLVAVLAIAGAVLLFYRMRVRTIHIQKKLLEEQVQERTQSLAMKTEEERKAREEASEANKELERKNKELEQFAYVASHDMQEPLRTISSFVELLQKQYAGRLDEKADKYMTYISQASDRMKVLINDLLEYSRIGRKKQFETVDCNQIVQQVLADLNAAIIDSKAQIIVGELPVVKAYPTEIKQVFQNLIVNAIKFRKKDTHPVIEISAERKGEYWQFSVRDNGIGIDPKHNDRIFVIFQRLHTRTEYEGSGIGLSHCKKIAELHKGKIWVESQPGSGSNFFFTIHGNGLNGNGMMVNKELEADAQ